MGRVISISVNIEPPKALMPPMTTHKIIIQEGFFLLAYIMGHRFNIVSVASKEANRINDGSPRLSKMESFCDEMVDEEDEFVPTLSPPAIVKRTDDRSQVYFSHFDYANLRFSLLNVK